MKKSKPTSGWRRWLKPGFLNAVGQPLAVLLQITALIAALYGFVRFVADIVEALRAPRLDLQISDEVWPVAEPNNKEDFAINLQFVVHNPTSRMVALRRLEAELVRPSRTATFPQRKLDNLQLEWASFIKGDSAGFQNAAPIAIKAIPAHKSEVLGVQLRGLFDRKDLSSSGSFDWSAGEYILRLFGYLNANDNRVELSPRSGFKFQLSKELSEQLSPAHQNLTESLTRPVRVVNSSGK